MKTLFFVFTVAFLWTGCNVFNSEKQPKEEAVRLFNWESPVSLQTGVFRGASVNDLDHLYVFGENNWYKSENYGKSFQQFNNPDGVYFTHIDRHFGKYYAIGTHDVEHPEFGEPDTSLFIPIWPTYSFFSSEDGNNWTQEFGNFQMRAFTFLDQNTLLLSINHGTRVYNLSDSSYTDSEFIFSDLTDLINVFVFENDETILAGAHDGIHRSEDNGLNWAKITAGKMHRDYDHVEKIGLLPDGTIIFYGSGFYSTTDRGETWQSVNLSYISEDDKEEKIYDYDVHISEEGFYYIAGIHGFYVAQIDSPNTVRRILEYSDSSWEINYRSRYDVVLGFSNGNVFLINKDLNKGLPGTKIRDFTVSDFEN